MDVFVEFSSCLPAIAEFLEPAPLCFGFDSGYSLATITYPQPIVEEPDYPLAVESRIHPEANLLLAMSCGAFSGKPSGRLLPGRRSSVARTQSSVPEFLAMSFETKEGMIRASSGLLGIVTDSSSLLSAVDGNHHRVQIEDQTVAFAGQSPEIGPEAVVEPGQLTNRLRIQSFQESSKSRLVRKTAQSQNFQKEAVVLQDFGLADALQPHNDGIQQAPGSIRKNGIGIGRG